MKTVFFKCSLSLLWIAMMAGTQQLFKIVRSLFGMVGIDPPQQLSRSKWPFNVRNLLILSFSLGMCIASFAFLILKADNVQDFGASFYSAITEFSIILGYLSLVFRKQCIFEIIVEMERIIRNSKFFNWKNCFDFRLAVTRCGGFDWFIFH